MAVVADDGPAAELMENAVAQVSRYLDGIGTPMASRKHGLLMVAFRRALVRYRAKLSRLEPIGGSHELSTRTSNDSWMEDADMRLEFEQLVQKLSARDAEVRICQTLTTFRIR
jgi:hypothetical protein